jgi:hypothetical protein
MAADQGNEGEGSRTAAKEYTERTKEFMSKEDVAAKAKEAAAALDSEEGEKLRRAEEEGRSHAKGEDPEVTKRP